MTITSQNEERIIRESSAFGGKFASAMRTSGKDSNMYRALEVRAAKWQADLAKELGATASEIETLLSDLAEVSD